jgi:hypothetical protein
MLMFFVALFFSLFGLAILSIPFWLALFPEREAPSEQAAREPASAPAPSRFFADQVVVPVLAHQSVPIEALLLQIETHVRLEHAAAESFLESPGSALLHTRTMSPLVQ